MFKTLMTSLPPQWVCSIVHPLKCKALVQKRRVMPHLMSSNVMRLQPGTTRRVTVSKHVKLFSSTFHDCSVWPFVLLIWVALPFLSPLLLYLINSNCMCAEVKFLVSLQKTGGIYSFLMKAELCNLLSWNLASLTLQFCSPAIKNGTLVVKRQHLHSQFRHFCLLQDDWTVKCNFLFNSIKAVTVKKCRGQSQNMSMGVAAENSPVSLKLSRPIERR